MVLHEFIDRSLDFSRALAVGLVVITFPYSAHERHPVWLDDFCGAIVEKLLDKDEHAGAERPCSSLPAF